jgi:hypothetical protein
MNIKISSSAYRDLLEGYRFYENQAEGIGFYFLDSLTSDIDSLLIHAGVHPVYFGKYNRLLSKKFPFAIYYTVVGKIVRVHAVLDCRKNPAWTKEKLK